MAFRPRIDPATGKPCCFKTNADGQMAFPPNACQPCKDHAAARGRRAASFRAAIDSTPPDPYRDGILKLQREEAARLTPAREPTPRPTTVPLDANGIPDAYAAGIRALQESHR